MKCGEDFDKERSRGGIVEAWGRSPKVKKCGPFCVLGFKGTENRNHTLDLERRRRSELGKSLLQGVFVLYPTDTWKPGKFVKLASSQIKYVLGRNTYQWGGIDNRQTGWR